jgi:hypothetical protein
MTIRRRVHIPSQEQVSNTCTREIETRRRPAALDNLESNNIEHRPNKLFLRRRNVRPQRVLGFYNLQPLLSRRRTLRRQAVVEESLDGCFLAVVVIGVIGDEADEATWERSMNSSPNLYSIASLLRTSPMPVWSQFSHDHPHSMIVRTWPAEDAYQLRRASAVITYRYDIAQGALLVFSHCLEHIDQVVGRATTGEHDDAFGFEAAVAVSHLWSRCCRITVRLQQRFGDDDHDDDRVQC